jgi:hypothetical protein
MALSSDPGIAEALPQMAAAMAEAKPPAVGDVAGRRGYTDYPALAPLWS